MKLTVLISMMILISLCNGQRQRGRGRGRGSKNRADQHCHFKEIDKCLGKIQDLAKGPNPTAIIRTADGIDKICSTLKEVVQCLKGFMKKCTTPLQRELFDFGLESVSQNTKQFCEQSSVRQTFLQHSPCIQGKVLNTVQYKENCNNNYLIALNYITNQTSDDRLDTLCCAHNSWEDCTNNLITKECGARGQESFKVFVEKALGGVTSMLCPRNLFPPTANTCKHALPSRSARARGKFGENAISKYILSYFSFLFAA